MSLGSGSILNGRYRIDALLGEGGMGAVYRALDTKTNEFVAIKEHFEDPSGRLQRSTDPAARVQLEKARVQFKQEAEVLARLSHPGLPKVRDYLVIPGEGQYLVMDFVEGQDIQVLLKQVGRIPEERVVRIGIEVCEILEYLHTQARPVIHRDIKPSNLRITPDGRVVLVDFGICKEAADTVTRTAARAVSAGYSPLEMYGERGKTDERSDIYSLAATLLALLTGIAPPSATDRLMDHDLPQVPQPMSPAGRFLQHVLDKGLSIRNEGRYESATRLASDLKQVLSQHGIADPPSKELLGSTSKPTRRVAELDLGAGTRSLSSGEAMTFHGGHWSPLGSGLPGIVFSLSSFDGKLIAAGSFETEGRSAIRNIASWDGTHWSPLGNGTNGPVYSLVKFQGLLIVAGEFTIAGGEAMRCIASWDGQDWLPLSHGLNGWVYALALYEGNLIAAGEFQSAGSESVHRIATWDGRSWSPLTQGMDFAVKSLIVCNKLLIAGGYFESAGKAKAMHVAAWNGSEWSPLGLGIMSPVLSLSVQGSNLIAGTASRSLARSSWDTFYLAKESNVGNMNPDRSGLFAWDTDRWSKVGEGVVGAVHAICPYGRYMIIGGDFLLEHQQQSQRIAAWNDTSWLSLSSGVDNFVDSLMIHEDRLIVGGRFRNAGGMPVSGVAAWSER